MPKFDRLKVDVATNSRRSSVLAILAIVAAGALLVTAGSALAVWASSNAGYGNGHNGVTFGLYTQSPLTLGFRVGTRVRRTPRCGSPILMTPSVTAAGCSATVGPRSGTRTGLATLSRSSQPTATITTTFFGTTQRPLGRCVPGGRLTMPSSGASAITAAGGELFRTTTIIRPTARPYPAREEQRDEPNFPPGG